jgi:aspartyl/asparaginyl beta-hydroxylase (cupin superfamily)
MRSLQNGQYSEARDYLEKAVAADSGNPLLWFHLALTCRAQADAGGEAAALERALAIDPYFYLALLQKGTLLERQGRPRQAAKAYHNFLSCLPPPAQQPPALKPAIERARRVIATNNAQLEAFIRASLPKPSATGTGSESGTGTGTGSESGTGSVRFDHCLEILFGRRRVFTPAPTWMHFPHLPALEFYDRAQFEWLGAFEAATADIRQELVNLLTSHPGGVEPYVDYPDGSPLNQWKDLNKSRKWGAYYLIRSGAAEAENLARCPRTAELLAAAPLADVPGQAPTAFFSLLEPRTRIPAHTGVTNTRLVCHVPLIVPPGCGFRVGAETREWKTGEAWVFDDTIEHEAWNDSDAPRAILIIDTWNPFLTEQERALVRAATVATTEFNRE